MESEPSVSANSILARKKIVKAVQLDDAVKKRARLTGAADFLRRVRGESFHQRPGKSAICHSDCVGR